MAAFLSCLCHLVAFLQHWFLFTTFLLPWRWLFQFAVLLAISLLLVFLALFIHSRTIIMVILMLRLLLLLILGLPLGEDVTIELTLMTPLLIEGFVYLPNPYNLLFSLGGIAAALSFQRPLIAWGQKLSRTSLANLLSFGIYGLALTMLCYLLVSYLERLAGKTRLVERLDKAVQQLSDANLGFQDYAMTVEEKSMAIERKRITREIHDTVGYALTNLIMMMEAAQRLTPGELVELQELHRQARDHAQEGLLETRRALRLLRSVEEKKIQGVKAVYKLVSAFERATGVRVKLEFGNVPWTLGQQIDGVVYRLIQEGMTNAFRHGKATEIGIYFWQDEGGIAVTVEDNGAGSDELKEGIGLLGMRERIEQLGGTIHPANTGSGFKLFARIPRPMRQTKV